MNFDAAASSEMNFAHIRVSEYFTFAKQIFLSVAISLARRANFVEKDLVFRQGLFLAMGYKKDILGSFAYEFELSHKSRQRRVYHQCEALHIISAEHCISSLRKRIQPAADDMHLR